MSTFYVDNTFDSGPGTLRLAVSSATSGSLIVVRTSGTLALTSGTITINNGLTIQGNGQLTLQAPSSADGFFSISTAEKFEFTNLQFFGSTSAVWNPTTSQSPYLVISNSTFDSGIKNTLSQSGAIFGGKLTLNMRLSVSNCVCKGTTDNGCIRFNDNGTSGSVVISGSVFDSNKPTGLMTVIYVIGSFTFAVTIDSCTITSNTFSTSLGSLYISATGPGTVTVIRSSFLNNINSGTGIQAGAIFSDATSTKLIVDSCTFVGNSIQSGSGSGAIHASTTGIEVLRSTITQNIGGGIGSQGVTMKVYSSIISNNTANDIGGTGTYISEGFNIYGTINAGVVVASNPFDIVSSAPGLGSVGYNGGLTPTMALTIGSPAFNANNDTTVSNPTYDQRNSPYLRLVGGFQDIGAFERQAPTSTTTEALVYTEDSPPTTNSLASMFTTSDGNNQVSFKQVSAADPSMFQSVSFSGTTITVQPAANRFGSTSLTVTAADLFGLTATGQISVVISPVNDPPSFDKGNNIEVKQGGVYEFSSWATNISPGPYEQGQIVSFLTNVVSTTNTITFDSLPTVNTNGTLGFELKSNTYGVANISVSATDDGGGNLTSGAQYFTITLDQTSVTKTPKHSSHPTHTRSRTPKPSKTPKPSESDSKARRFNLVEQVDPASALLVGVVIAKMTVNLWRWASSLWTFNEVEMDDVKVKTGGGDLKLCRMLLEECETKIEMIQARQEGGSTTDEKWLLYSLEDLRDDIMMTLKSRKLASPSEVVEFKERMEALEKDYDDGTEVPNQRFAESAKASSVKGVTDWLFEPTRLAMVSSGYLPTALESN